MKKTALLLMIVLPWIAIGQPGKVYTSIEEVQQPEEVYELRLRHKRLRAIPEEVYGYKNLRRLDVSHNRIDSLPPTIGQLSNLEELTLSDNRLTALPMEMGLLGKLRVLEADRNPLEMLPEEMGYLTSLEKIAVWSTYLYELPETFENLDGTLHVLDLRSCRLSITDQEGIRRLLPTVKILWDQACNCR